MKTHPVKHFKVQRHLTQLLEREILKEEGLVPARRQRLLLNLRLHLILFRQERQHNVRIGRARKVGGRQSFRFDNLFSGGVYLYYSSIDRICG